MTLKLSALEGVLFVTIVLGAIGGALQIIAVQLTQDPSVTAWLGVYQAPLLAFLSNSWIFIIATFLFNIFLYLRQHQLAALNKTIEDFKIQKFTATLAWFVAVLGPAAAFITDKQLAAEIAFVIVIVSALVKELQNIMANQTTLQVSEAAQPQSTTSTTTSKTTSTTQ